MSDEFLEQEGLIGDLVCGLCNLLLAYRFKVFKGKVQGKVNNTGAAMKKRFSAKEW
jgi:hypothetical protein